MSRSDKNIRHSGALANGAKRDPMASEPGIHTPQQQRDDVRR
jgi:hypothetical protein